MKSTLSGPVFQKTKIVKTYTKDFAVKTLKEETEFIDQNGIKGTSTEISLNGIQLSYRDIICEHNYSVTVAHDFPLFKLHFEIEGENRYTPLNHNSRSIFIPSGHYNLFYLPEVDGILSYNTRRRKTLELKFTESYIRKIVGTEYHDGLRELYEAISKNKSYLFWNQCQLITPELRKIINDIISCPYTASIKKAYLEAKITELIVIVLDKSLHPEIISSISINDYEAIIEIENYIKRNLDKTITISELASIIGFNTSKLKQYFKQVFGNTVFKHITNLKMQRAQKLILEDHLTISEASLEVGYKNPQHFTVAYKKTFGTLPKELIK